MRRWLVIPLCLGLASCDAVRDHVLVANLARSFGRLGKALDPARAVEKAGRRLGHLKDRTVSLMPWENGRLAAFGAIPGRLAHAAGHRAGPGLRRAADDSVALVDREIQSGLHLLGPDSTMHTLLSSSRAGERLGHARDMLPRLLGLYRQPLPSPTDPNRQTGTAYPTRRETWMERVFRRIRL